MEIKLCKSCFQAMREEICEHCGYDEKSTWDNKDGMQPGTCIANRFLVGQKLKEDYDYVVYQAYDSVFECQVAFLEGKDLSKTEMKNIGRWFSYLSENNSIVQIYNTCETESKMYLILAKAEEDQQYYIPIMRNDCVNRNPEEIPLAMQGRISSKYIVYGELLQRRYMIRKVIGVGGFGITYLAWDNYLLRYVAIKEFFPEQWVTRTLIDYYVNMRSPSYVERYQNALNDFIDEGRRTAQFRNQKEIIDIYDMFEENDTAYLVLEYLSGSNIGKRMKSIGTYSYENALQIIKPVIHAIGEVHQAGFIHRDISPGNIMFTDDGQVKLIDFGSSAILREGRAIKQSIVIKQGYAPIEQYSEELPEGTWSDIYAFGATLYYMLVGTKPPNAAERMKKDRLKKPSKIGIKLNKNAEKLLMQCLAIKREERVQTAEEVSMLLE